MAILSSAHIDPWLAPLGVDWGNPTCLSQEHKDTGSVKSDHKTYARQIGILRTLGLSAEDKAQGYAELHPERERCLEPNRKEAVLKRTGCMEPVFASGASSDESAWDLP